jgi:hypothetical protein
MEGALRFTVEDITKLMTHCRDAGVSEFHGGGVKFSLVNDPLIRASAQNNAPAVIPTKDLDQLLIEDPRAYEEAMREID